MKQITRLIYTTALLTLCGGANAALLQINGGTETTETITMGGVPVFSATAYQDPADLTFTQGGSFEVRFTYWYSSADFSNSFLYNGETMINNKDGTLTNSQGTALTSVFDPDDDIGLSSLNPDVSQSQTAWKSVSSAGPNGLLGIDFAIDTLGITGDPNKRSYFAAFCEPSNPFACGSGAKTGSSLFLFLDDGGAGPDGDFNDLVVQIELRQASAPTTVVPIPAALPLFGSALAFLGWLGLQRRRQYA